MKAIILAGGTGSRLYPLTVATSKQLQPIFDKPMIYYPLTLLIAARISEICLICTPSDFENFERLLGDGSQWGISLEYRIQEKPNGIGEAFLLAEDFIGSENVVLLLGDNLFSGSGAFPTALKNFQSGATIFAYHVSDPRQYAVVTFRDDETALSIEEKPREPKSNFAVPGLYIYDNKVLDYAKSLKPSARGELEITDINQKYLDSGELKVKRLSRGFVWMDAGSSTAIHEASVYVETVERRQGIKIGCPEEAALMRGMLDLEGFERLLAGMPVCDYTDYLQMVASEFKRDQLIRR